MYVDAVILLDFYGGVVGVLDIVRNQFLIKLRCFQGVSVLARADVATGAFYQK